MKKLTIDISLNKRNNDESDVCNNVFDILNELENFPTISFQFVPQGIQSVKASSNVYSRKVNRFSGRE